MNKKIHMSPGSLLAIIIGAIGIIAIAVYAVRSTEIRSKAFTSGPILSMNPSQVTLAIGETQTVGIILNTNGDSVSAVGLRIFYNPNQVEISNITIKDMFPIMFVQPKTESLSDTGQRVTTIVGTRGDTPFRGSAIIGTFIVKKLTTAQSRVIFGELTSVASVGKPTNSLMSSSPIIIY